MPLRDDLLTPIPGADPAGADLRYDPVYDKIKEARRRTTTRPQGDWQRERKAADWLAGGQAGKRRARRPVEGSPARRVAHRGPAPSRGIRRAARRSRPSFNPCCSTSGRGSIPEIEDGDAEMRAAPLAWMGDKLATVVRTRAAQSYR